MSKEEPRSMLSVVPYDSDGHLLEALWSRLSGAIRRIRTQAGRRSPAADKHDDDAARRAEPAERRMVVSPVRHRRTIGTAPVALFAADRTMAN